MAATSQSVVFRNCRFQCTSVAVNDSEISAPGEIIPGNNAISYSELQKETADTTRCRRYGDVGHILLGVARSIGSAVEELLRQMASHILLDSTEQAVQAAHGRPQPPFPQLILPSITSDLVRQIGVSRCQLIKASVEKDASFGLEMC
ncbi:hypothetical protein Pan189_05230 [Stratiformator vulcanicus]|uniref:Uncharacterized protein n=1 Tax=Stratiformator vulcanicus TaxID=2527980 RepID=A0A517QX65_9PLAN|nr:hypothetical protein Pan189_05230 [Stratiformator vulcanicus]